MIDNKETYKFEKISNGFLATKMNGDRIFVKDENGLMLLISGPISNSLKIAQEHVWDGNFFVTIQHNILD